MARGSFSPACPDFAELNRRACLVMAQEVGVASAQIEASVVDLIEMLYAAAETLRLQRHRAGSVASPVCAAPPEILQEFESQSHVGEEAIARLIVGLQFQDRTRQQLTHVIDTLLRLGEAAPIAPHAATPGNWDEGLDDHWQRAILAGQTLGEVHTKLVGLHYPPADIAGCPLQYGGSVDLF